MTTDHSEYAYQSATLGHSHTYLLPVLGRILDELRPARVFEVGCGNGSVANWLHSRGLHATGIDSSESGIQQAKWAYPKLELSLGSAYDDLVAKHGAFPVVISLEVVEHLYSPRVFANTLFNLLEPGGTAIISTPYHGYFKNLALALSGRFDAHFSALWDGGHIKFWSPRTLARLLVESGFMNLHFYRVGRIPPFAKSMIVTAEKPRS